MLFFKEFKELTEDHQKNIIWEVNLGRCCGVLFLDLKKAFDTVNHTLLVSKLKQYGVRNKSLKWFESYLAGRLQVTKVGGEHSPSAEVTCGVPQGSILGPLLFTIYINDLPMVSDSTRWNLYADDTAITFFKQYQTRHGKYPEHDPRESIGMV